MVIWMIMPIFTVVITIGKNIPFRTKNYINK
nr:MAG TPA: hypothetical protein [Caudoviricetes sp.]